MKVTALGILFSVLPQQSASFKCGIKGFTSRCIGDTDIRYNPDISYDLKELDVFWKLFEGLYVGDHCIYLADGTPQSEVYLPGLPKESGFGSWDGCNQKSFLNITFDGSRYYRHEYIVSKHNADGPGGLQLPGFVNPTDFFGTSTFQKNAKIKKLGTIGGYDPGGGNFTVDTANLLTLTPVGNKSYIALTDKRNSSGEDPELYESTRCVDSECNQISLYIEGYTLSVDGTRAVDYSVRASSIKVDKDTWMEELSKAFTKYNVPTPNDPFTEIPEFDGNGFTQPFDPTTSDSAPECHTLDCPTEDDWKEQDPYLGTSPYIEPFGDLHTAFVIPVPILILYVIYTFFLEHREKRLKGEMLRSIANSMGLTKSKQLKRKDLKKMYDMIDDDCNGVLEKSEVRSLIDEAGIDSMSEKDYDILFAAIDLDGDGTLDFMEFCAFFASISVGESESETRRDSSQDHLYEEASIASA